MHVEIWVYLSVILRRQIRLVIPGPENCPVLSQTGVSSRYLGKNIRLEQTCSGYLLKCFPPSKNRIFWGLVESVYLIALGSFSVPWISQIILEPAKSYHQSKESLGEVLKSSYFKGKQVCLVFSCEPPYELKQANSLQKCTPKPNNTVLFHCSLLMFIQDNGKPVWRC